MLVPKAKTEGFKHSAKTQTPIAAESLLAHQLNLLSHQLEKGVGIYAPTSDVEEVEGRAATHGPLPPHHRTNSL